MCSCVYLGWSSILRSIWESVSWNWVFVCRNNDKDNCTAWIVPHIRIYGFCYHFIITRDKRQDPSRRVFEFSYHSIVHAIAWICIDIYTQISSIQNWIERRRSLNYSGSRKNKFCRIGQLSHNPPYEDSGLEKSKWYLYMYMYANRATKIAG